MSREFDELLSAYLDGEVSPEERAAVERRLEQSPGLRETLDELSEVGDLIRGLPRARAPIDLSDRVVAAISAPPATAAPEVGTTTPPTRRRRGAWPLLAAGTVLAAGVAIVVLMPEKRADLGPQMAATERPAPMVMEAAPAGEFARTAGPVPAIVSMGATNLSTATAADTRSLTEYVRKLERKPRPGEVLSTVRDNAGQTQVFRYTVVDTREIAGSMKTIFANNSLNIVETETPAPQAGAPAAPESASRFVYYVEGPPQQVEQTLDEIESLPVFQEVADLGVLAAEGEPVDEALFGGNDTTPAKDFSLSATNPGNVPSNATPPSAAPAASTLDGAAVESRGLSADKLAEAKQDDAVKALSAAPAGIPLSAEEKAGSSTSPKAANTFLGVSAQLDSHAPLVENVLTRSAGNSIQGNAIQRNVIMGNSLQRQATGQSQSGFFRSRNMLAPEERLERKAAESEAVSQQSRWNDAKGAVPLKQQSPADRFAANAPAGPEPAPAVREVPSAEEPLIRALIILEPQPATPAAASPATAPQKAND